MIVSIVVRKKRIVKMALGKKDKEFIGRIYKRVKKSVRFFTDKLVKSNDFNCVENLSISYFKNMGLKSMLDDIDLEKKKEN